MQKIFIRRFLIIMLITVCLTLMGNYLLQTIFSEVRAEEDAAQKVTEISRRIHENDIIIENLTASLDDNYITRAKAFAELIAENPQMIESFDEMERIAGVLNVDEVHVTDENGILRWGNVQEYYGLDFQTTEQTRPFLPALTDKNFALAQKPQLNGSIGRLFQYISVARQDKPGIVQVGVVPEVLDNALANNKIDAVVADFNVEKGINVIAYSPDTGLAVADTKKALIGKSYSELGITEALFLRSQQSGWIHQDSEKLFAVTSSFDDYVVEITYTQDYLFRDRKNQSAVAAFSAILLGAAIIIAIFILLKRMIILDMGKVTSNLEEIKGGNFDVSIDVHSTPEFVVLSEGMNQMLSSIRTQMAEITQQAEQLEERNHNILSSLSYARKIQNNLLPSSRPFDETFSDYSILWKPRDEVGGDIYWMKCFQNGAVLCVSDCTGHGTPGALLTMLVVTALDTIVQEGICERPADILRELDLRLVSTLNASEPSEAPLSIQDGADVCILYISRDSHILLSSAKLHVFICDGTSVEDIKGQKLTLGDGSIRSSQQIRTLSLSCQEGMSCYIVSDGLFEQVGGKSLVPFGYRRFKQIILDNHGKTEEEVLTLIWTEFQLYMGSESRRDDVTLIGFKL